jgi:hypothetical protein
VRGHKPQFTNFQGKKKLVKIVPIMEILDVTFVGKLILPASDGGAIQLQSTDMPTSTPITPTTQPSGPAIILPAPPTDGGNYLIGWSQATGFTFVPSGSQPQAQTQISGVSGSEIAPQNPS